MSQLLSISLDLAHSVLDELIELWRLFSFQLVPK